MPAYERAMQSFMQQFMLRGGKQIFVRGTNGSDAGDGTEAGPYATLTRGFTGAEASRMRSGAFDILRLEGTVQEADVLVLENQANFCITAGSEQIVGGSSAGRPQPPAVQEPVSYGIGAASATSRFFVGGALQVTVSGHGFAAGDQVLHAGFNEQGSGATSEPRHNGLMEITTIAGVDVYRIAGGAPSPYHIPFVGTAGQYPDDDFNTAVAASPPALVLRGCSNFILDGLRFDVSDQLFNNKWCVVVLENCRDAVVANCEFRFASLCIIGDDRPSLSINAFPAGLDVAVERCKFLPSFDSASHTLTNRFSSIYVQGTANPSFHDCFVGASFFGSFSTYADTDSEGLINVVKRPGLGMSMTNCRLFDVLGANSNYSKLLHLDDPDINTTSGTTRRMFVQHNFYENRVDGSPVNVSDAIVSGSEVVQDIEPLEQMDQALQQTYGNLVWRQRKATVEALSGTMAEFVSSLATAAQVAGVSGQVADVDADLAAVSGLVNTVNTTLTAVSGDVATLQSTLDVVSGEVSRLFGRNQRTRLAYLVSGAAARNVAVSGVSHLVVEVKDEVAADWSSPTTHYVVFAYQVGAVATDPPASAGPQDSAPVDGTFTLVPFP